MYFKGKKMSDKNNLVNGDPATNKFEENYEVTCVNCGQMPTVDIDAVSGKKVSISELCGACFFGEARCIDPAEWSKI